MLHIVHVISDLVAGRAEVPTSSVTARGLRDRIVIWGSRSDVEDLLLGLNVASFSSVFGEGFPHVLGEVTACGPPVCSQTSGMPNDLLVTQVMLVAKPGEQSVGLLYSSWPLVEQRGLHSNHCGELKSTNGASAITLDEYFEHASIQKILFVKMDGDGHECDVLRGAVNTLTQHKPTIVLEVAPQALEETGHSLEELLTILVSIGYVMCNLSNDEVLPENPSAIRAMIPLGDSMNVLAKPCCERPLLDLPGYQDKL